jgi:predicted O-methyltransferase YrrM
MNEKIPGWMFERDLEVLSYLASCVPDHGSMLEIGPFLGRSTSALVDSKKDTVSLDVVDTFTGIPTNKEYQDIQGDKDFFDRLRNVAQETGDWEQSFRICQESNIQKMNVFKTSSQSFEIRKQYDLSFIDSEHDFVSVSADIKKFINTTGILVGDDYVPRWPDVARAVNIFQLRYYRTLVVPRGSKIWVLVPEMEYWKKCIKEII